MFSVAEKRRIADQVQEILRSTNHPELPKAEIRFRLHVDGDEAWSWADIQNNGDVLTPDVNPWNESQDSSTKQPTKLGDLDNPIWDGPKYRG